MSIKSVKEWLGQLQNDDVLLEKVRKEELRVMRNAANAQGLNTLLFADS